jgi:hypothetical protein
MNILPLPVEISEELIVPMSKIDQYDLHILNKNNDDYSFQHYSSLITALYREKYDYARHFKIPQKHLQVLREIPDELLPFLLVLNILEPHDLSLDSQSMKKVVDHSLKNDDGFILEKIIPHASNENLHNIVVELSRTNPLLLNILSAKFKLPDVPKIDIQLNLETFINLIGDELINDKDFLLSSLKLWTTQQNTLGEIGIWLKERVTKLLNPNEINSPTGIPLILDTNLTRVKYLYELETINLQEESDTILKLCDSNVNDKLFQIHKIIPIIILDSNGDLIEKFILNENTDIINCLIQTSCDKLVLNKEDTTVVYRVLNSLLSEKYYPSARILVDYLVKLDGNLDSFIDFGNPDVKKESLFVDRFDFALKMDINANTENKIQSDMFLGKMSLNNYRMFSTPKTLYQFLSERKHYGDDILPKTFEIRGYPLRFCQQLRSHLSCKYALRSLIEKTKYNGVLLQCIAEEVGWNFQLEPNKPIKTYDLIYQSLKCGDLENIKQIHQKFPELLSHTLDRYFKGLKLVARMLKKHKQIIPNFTISSYVVEYLWNEMNEKIVPFIPQLEELSKVLDDPSLMEFLNTI